MDGTLHGFNGKEIKFFKNDEVAKYSKESTSNPQMEEEMNNVFETLELKLKETDEM